MKLSQTILNFFLISLISITAAAAGPTAEQVDAQLAKLWRGVFNTKQNEPDNYNKLESANKELLKYLKFVCVDPQVMAAPLKKASDSGLSILTSDDKKLRCYSWDTLTGGTMHFFYALVAYDTGNKQLKCEVCSPGPGAKEDPGAYFEELYTIKTRAGKSVYLVQDVCIASNINHVRNIQAYVIANSKLTKYPFFQTPRKVLDSISFEFSEYGDDTNIVLSGDKNTIKIPIIKAEPNSFGSGKATGKFLTYYFDGNRFVFGKKK